MTRIAQPLPMGSVADTDMTLRSERGHDATVQTFGGKDFDARRKGQSRAHHGFESVYCIHGCLRSFGCLEDNERTSLGTLTEVNGIAAEFAASAVERVFRQFAGSKPVIRQIENQRCGR